MNDHDKGEQSMGARSWARMLLALAIGLGSLALTAPAAQASAGPPPESGLQCVNMTPNACWAHQVVFRGDPMLEFANWTRAKWPNGFNHSHNGCSVQQAIDVIEEKDYLPDGLVGLVNTYADFFRPACRIHDFGYRNFGSGTRGGFKQYAVQDRFLTANQRSWNEPNSKLTIDHRFGDLMHSRCDNATPPEVTGPNGWWCHRAADAFEIAVRERGHID